MTHMTTARTLTLTFTLALLTPVMAQTAPVQTASGQTAPAIQMKMTALAPVTLRRDARLGTLLTGPTGLTLYTFAKDAPEVSNCEGVCATNWPPLLLSEVPRLPAGLSGKFSLISRKDGQTQLSYDGAALYSWKGDAKPGDINGQGFMNVWHAANAGPSVQVSRVDDLGMVLAGPTGLTLYTFAKDAPGVSNCEGACATNWPPLLVAQFPATGLTAGVAVRGKLGTLTRKDGSLQVTYNGLPVYNWKNDLKRGDALGEGFMGVWSAVRR